MVWSLVGAGVASAAGHLGGHLAFGRGIGQGRRVDESLGPVDDSPARAAVDGAAAVDGSVIDGSVIDGSVVDGSAADDRLVVGIDAAAEVLGVPPANVQVMIDEGLVEPIGGSPPAFRRTDLDAVRLLGG